MREEKEAVTISGTFTISANKQLLCSHRRSDPMPGTTSPCLPRSLPLPSSAHEISLLVALYRKNSCRTVWGRSRLGGRCFVLEVASYHLLWMLFGLNTFKYHVSWTDEKISVRINLLFYLFFHRRPIQQLGVSSQ